MRIMFRKLIGTALCVLLLTGSVGASGFSIFEQGTRAMGVAGAFAARAADLSAVFHNPAGLAQLYGTHIQLGGTAISVGPSFTLAGTYQKADSHKQWFFPPTFYAGSRINDKLFAAIGVGAPFGLGMKWDDDWIGKHLIREINLHIVNISPTIAYNYSDKLNIGVGLNYAHATADLDRYAAFLIPRVLIEGDGNGLGFNLGLQYKKTEHVTFGISFRSRMKLDLSGDATFTYAYTDQASLAVLQAQYPNSGASLSVTTPSITCFGVNFRPDDKLSLELNVNFLNWSSYDKLEIKFDDDNLQTISDDKDWKNVSAYRFGMEYYLNETWTLRCGAYYDQNPVEDRYLEPMLPDADRNGINLGFGWTNGKMTIDAAYLHIFVKDNGTNHSIKNFNGVYENSSDLFGVSFGYKIN